MQYRLGMQGERSENKIVVVVSVRSVGKVRRVSNRWPLTKTSSQQATRLGKQADFRLALVVARSSSAGAGLNRR